MIIILYHIILLTHGEGPKETCTLLVHVYPPTTAVSLDFNISGWMG